MIHQAWIRPGIQPKMVSPMLIRRSAPHPRLRKTASWKTMLVIRVIRARRCKEGALQEG